LVAKPTVKITRIDTIPLSLPLKKPMLMAGRLYSGAEAVVVRVETTGRFPGWGEASVAPFLTGETVASIIAAVSIISDAIVGQDARNLTALAEVMHKAIVGNSAAKAAVDMALYDAVARELDVPVCRLLGGTTASEFACLWLVGNSDRGRDLAEARARAADGFRYFKLKVANNDLVEEAQTLIEMRKALDPKLTLCADANAGWSAAEGVRFVRLAEQAALAFLEQPVAGDDHHGMIRVAKASSVPIGADEGIHSIGDVRRLIESGAAIGGSFKIMKFEGVTRCLAAIRLCQALGGEVNLSGKLGESSVANAAALALATAAGRLPWGLTLTQHYLAEDIVRTPITIRNGLARPLDGPGLGIEIDETKVARFEIHPATPSTR
jgi:L-alanine-DL-glutamate epimerase-like enolase superfamily enzyme